VQALAAWFIARPQNAVLGLAATLLLPYVPPQLTSGVVLSLLVVAQGTRLAVIEALAAAALLVAVTLIFGLPVVSIVALMTGAWAPVLFLAVMLVTTRSLALTMQVSVIVAIVGMLGFHVVVADPTAFWQPVLTAMSELARQSGLELNTELLNAEVMTVSATLAMWTLSVTGLLLGYGLYRKLPGDIANYGLFRNLSFGKVLAVALALVSLVGFLAGVPLLESIAMVLFVAFCVQGLSIVHWMHASGMLPLGAVIATYVLLPLLQVLLITVLAVLGYMDVWFGFRRRMKKA